jgi:hypothetical protein
MNGGFGDQSSAAELRVQLIGDIRVCLDMLTASGKRANMLVRQLLQAILDEDAASTELAESDVRMLRMGKQIRASCPHLELGDVDGFCWICVTGQELRQRAEEVPVVADMAPNNIAPPDFSLNMPTGGGRTPGDHTAHSKYPASDPSVANLAASITSDSSQESHLGVKWILPILFSSGSSFASVTSTTSSASSSDPPRVDLSNAPTAKHKQHRKRNLRFAPNVLVYETYAPEDYPARSQFAPDHADDKPLIDMRSRASRNDGASDAVGTDVFGRMLLQRQGDGGKLPNLRDYW